MAEAVQVANDAQANQHKNAKFKVVETPFGVLRPGFQTLTRVVLVAVKPIPPNTEIFVSYGQFYWY